MQIYTKIAYRDGTLFTVWGPCSSNGQPDPCGCPQCKHADQLKAGGKEWEEEYQKALGVK